MKTIKRVMKKIVVKGKQKITKPEMKLDKIQELIFSVIKTEADKKYFHYEFGSGCYEAVKFFYSLSGHKPTLNKVYTAEQIFKGIDLVQKGNKKFVRRVVRKILERVFKVRVLIVEPLPTNKEYALTIKFVK